MIPLLIGTLIYLFVLGVWASTLKPEVRFQKVRLALLVSLLGIAAIFAAFVFLNRSGPPDVIVL